jgi:hypothetical protein
MRRTRIIGAGATVVALLTATAATGTAGAATPSGVGTSKASTTVLNVALGSNGALLNIRVLGDDGTANIDPKVATPASAASAISPLTSSSSVSALNIVVPKVSVSSTGAPVTKSVPTISLATPVSSGSIAPLSLSAVVDAAQGATSGLNSTLSNVTAAGGLLSVPSLTSSLGASAKPGDADGLRGVNVPSVQVLNLGAVLQGLGVNPANLSVGQVANALDALQKTVTSGTSQLNGTQLTALSGLQQVLTTLPPGGVSGLPASTTIASLPAPVQSLITTALGGSLPVGVANIGDLSTLLTGTITNAVNTLASTPLLQVDNLVVGISTKAADSVANSASTIQASLGAVKVGNVSLPGVDLASTTTQVTTLVNSVQSKVNGVLNTVGLGNLVTVKVLDQAKSVASDKGYVNALANLTALHVAIAPLSSVAPGTAQAAGDTVGTILGSSNVPALSTAMASLNALLPTSTVGALTAGATVDALSIGASSAFAPAAAPVTPAVPTPANGTLAVTGGRTQALGLVGLLLLAMVAGLRWLRRPVTTN